MAVPVCLPVTTCIEFNQSWIKTFKRKYFPKRKTRTNTLEKVLTHLLTLKQCFEETFQKRVNTFAAKILREFTLSRNETVLFLMLRYANVDNINKIIKTLIESRNLKDDGSNQLFWEPVYNLSCKYKQNKITSGMAKLLIKI